MLLRKIASGILILLVLCTISCFDISNISRVAILPSDTAVIEVEGYAASGYSVGSDWISCYENEIARYARLLGPGKGPDGMANTDSRPCLRYELDRRNINEFIALIVKCASETGMERIYFNEETGLVDGEPEFECLYYWED